MAKKTKGLPSDFGFTVDEEAIRPAKPVDLGDFIDENIPERKPAPRAKAPRKEEPPAPAKPEPPPLEAQRQVEEPEQAPSPSIATDTQRGVRRPRRREMTLDSETERMLDSLVDADDEALRPARPQPGEKRELFRELLSPLLNGYANLAGATLHMPIWQNKITAVALILAPFIAALLLLGRRAIQTAQNYRL